MGHLVQQYEVGRESLAGPMYNRRSANSSGYRPVEYPYCLYTFASGSPAKKSNLLTTGPCELREHKEVEFRMQCIDSRPL